MFLKVPFKHIQNSVVIENEVLQMLWNTKIHMIKRERSKISENLRSLRIWDLTFNLLSWLLWAKQWIELTNSIFKLPWLYNTLVNLGKKDHQKRSAVTLGKVWRSPFLPQQGLQWRTWKQLTARGSDMLPHLRHSSWLTAPWAEISYTLRALPKFLTHIYEHNTFVVVLVASFRLAFNAAIV
jgi:hypothetical protein